MNRYEMEVYASRRYGKHIGFLANVINAHYGNPQAKLKGLMYLAFHDRVGSCSGTLDFVRIDGIAKPWSDLERYAGLFSTDEDRMLAHLVQCVDRTAYTLASAKLRNDQYHNCIQSAAKAIMMRAEQSPTNFPYYSAFKYAGSYNSGNSYWYSEDDTEVLSYNYDDNKFTVQPK